MTAYYNEFDPYKAQWLRNLIAAGHIAPGIVDERSILDVHPQDLEGFTQCHFFAGVGVWSYALRCAGWPDGRPVWTASCPCQPFSEAGKRKGVADERHLWPAVEWLVSKRRPSRIYGEQVASRDAAAWIDLVSSDMEGLDYAFGAAVSPASGYGAPHGRHRTYFVGDANRDNAWWHCGDVFRPQEESSCRREVNGDLCLGVNMTSGTYNMADTERRGLQSWSIRPSEPQTVIASENRDLFAPLADAADRQLSQSFRGSERGDGYGSNCEDTRTGPTNGFWRIADWLSCRDGKWRAVEPGTFPLANGIASRMGRLRAYGDAIVAPQAVEFIRATM